MKFMANTKSPNENENFLVIKTPSFSINGTGLVGDRNPISFSIQLDEFKTIYGIDRSCQQYHGFGRNCLFV